MLLCNYFVASIIYFHFHFGSYRYLHFQIVFFLNTIAYSKNVLKEVGQAQKVRKLKLYFQLFSSKNSPRSLFNNLKYFFLPIVAWLKNDFAAIFLRIWIFHHSTGEFYFMFYIVGNICWLLSKFYFAMCKRKNKITSFYSKIKLK